MSKLLKQLSDITEGYQYKYEVKYATREWNGNTVNDASVILASSKCEDQFNREELLVKLTQDIENDNSILIDVSAMIHLDQVFIVNHLKDRFKKFLYKRETLQGEGSIKGYDCSVVEMYPLKHPINDIRFSIEVLFTNDDIDLYINKFNKHEEYLEDVDVLYSEYIEDAIDYGGGDTGPAWIETQGINRFVKDLDEIVSEFPILKEKKNIVNIHIGEMDNEIKKECESWWIRILEELCWSSIL